MAKRIQHSRRLTPTPKKSESNQTSIFRRCVNPAWGTATLLALAVWAVYGQSLHAPFIFDDNSAIIANDSIVSLWPLIGDDVHPGPLNPPLFLPTSARPLANLSLAFNYAAGGLNPAGYHLVNIFLHWCSAMLLWAIVRRTLRMPSFCGHFQVAAGWLATGVALLWALHPLQTETIIYTTQRTELMMALCYLGTLYCSIRYWEAIELGNRAGWLTAAVLACVAGMLSKEVMVSAPLIVLLFERTFVAASLGNALRKSWPLYLGLVSSWVLLLLLNLNSPHSDAAGFHLGVSLLAWWFTQAKIFLLYLKLTVWPWPLVIHYELPYVDSFAAAWPYLLAVGVLGLATLILLWRNHPIGFLGVCVFVILSPTSIVPIVTEMAAERRMYLPLAALITLAVAGGYSLVRAALRRGNRDRLTAYNDNSPLVAIGVAATLIVIAFSLISFERLVVYEDPMKLWLQVVKLQPENHLAHQNVGAELVQADRAQEAIPWYRKAIELNPKATQAHYNLGLLLLRANLFDAAIAEFQEAVKQRPDLAEFHNNLGVALFTAGRIEEAIPLFLKTLELKPSMWSAHDNLGRALARSGQWHEAIANYEQALQINSEALDVYSHLADAYAHAKEPAKAIAVAEKALAVARSSGEYELAEKISLQVTKYREILSKAEAEETSAAATPPSSN